MRISIVIPAHGQRDLLIECVQSIEDTCPDVHSSDFQTDIHIIDNGSVPSLGICDLPITERRKIVRRSGTLFNENVGVTKAWNRGIDHAMEMGAEVICICNSDVVFGPMVIANCVKALTDLGHYAAFPLSKQGGPKEPDFDAKASQYAGLDLASNIVMTGGFAGWCFFLSRECVEKVGRFDEQFTLWYQDTDFHRRLHHIAKPAVEVRACYLHHYESRTILSMPNQFNCNGWRAQDEINFKAKYPLG